MFNAKQIAGEKSTRYIKNGMVVGLGTGSTAYWAIKKVGQLVSEGLIVKCVPTSENTKDLAQELKIPLIDISRVEKIDITIDGADEVDKNKDLIKGGGGALLREKIVASITEFYIVIVDASKRVETLGKFPVPVEVTQFAYPVTERQLSELGCVTHFRLSENNAPFITDNGNFIVDCNFNRIEKPDLLTTRLNCIPGVVENGIFANKTDLVISADSNGNVIEY